MSVLLRVLLIIGLLAACGLFLWFFPGALDPPSLKRAQAQNQLNAYKAYEKGVPIVVIDGVPMYMDPDGHWVEVEPDA